jgi:HD-like signal output (HDOD) protein
MSDSIGSKTATPLADRIVEAVERDEVQIPPLPELTIRLGELLSRDDVDARQVADLVRSDPAVAASLLRIANSAVFGGLHKVTELRQAIARLGLRQVHGIVTALQIKGNFTHDSRGKSEILHVIWDHSVATAFAARRLAQRMELDGEEAFLAGLLHDTGRLLVLKAIDKLESELDAPPTRPVVDELMDMLHPRLGHAALSRWQIPESIARIALHHEEPPREGDPLLLCIQAADLVTAKLGFNLTPAPEIDLLQEDSVARLELSDIEIATLMVDLEDELEEIRKLF